MIKKIVVHFLSLWKYAFFKYLNKRYEQKNCATLFKPLEVCFFKIFEKGDQQNNCARFFKIF